MIDSDLFIKGGVFGETTKLRGILSKRMNIVYGRNGSGKSTIARAFREQLPVGQDENPVRHFELSTDGSGNLKADICEHVFVFNEDFVDAKVKVKEGLKSIIRIGRSAEFDGPIQEARTLIKNYQADLKKLKDKIDTLSGSASTSGSIKEADNKIKEGLKKPGGYTDRLFKIEGKQNLVASVLNPVLNFDPNDTLPDSVGETARKLSEDINRFLSFKSGSAIEWPLPKLSQLPDLEKVNALLRQTVRPAELTLEEKRILDELSQDLAAENFIPKTERLIINSPRDFCPLCHQPVSQNHKHTLEQRLVKFRDKAVQTFKGEISDAYNTISSVSVSLPSFPNADYDNDIAHAETKIQELNAFISAIKETLVRKESNPFSPMDSFDENAFSTLVSTCQDSLSSLSKDVSSYNQTLGEKDALKKSIDQMNIRLAYHENKTWIDTYVARLATFESIKADYSALEKRIADQNSIIDSLSAQSDQVDDAREQINHYLDIIFGTNKLKLVPAGKESYKLQIKQGDKYVDISPKAGSSGERNALALAYFFACVMEKKDENYDYGDPTLLVIDDPVSSFDAENKAGVLSLLSYQIKRVLNGNEQSKVLVFTHDHTTLKGLCEQRDQIFSEDKNETNTFLRLRYDHKLKEIPCSFILENMDYYNDLQSIYYFADYNEPEDYDECDAMGNLIRSFAESYATRMFKCKWFDLFSDERRLNCIPEEKREKIKAFAMRPVLNSESHGVSHSFEPEEIQRAAKVLLVYIFYASRDHLFAYLVGRNSANEDRLDKIKLWADSF